MEKLSFEQFEAVAADYDAVVAAVPQVDPFCTSSDWIVPARRAFAEDATPFVLRSEHGWAPLMMIETALGPTVMPLEASWGLASPIVAREPSRLVAQLHGALTVDHTAWRALFFCGITRGGDIFRALLHYFAGSGRRLGLGQPTVRSVASLEGGYEGFLGRRDARFAKNLRRIRRNAERELIFEHHDGRSGPDGIALFARIVAVERRSWKGRSGHGIDTGPMNRFYAAMIPRLARRGALRVGFAVRDGVDVGYILGGTFGGEYRGLQVSYDHDFRHLSIGNLLQDATIRALCAEGVGVYDLGTEMAYKHGWAETQRETVALVVR